MISRGVFASGLPRGFPIPGVLRFRHLTAGFRIIIIIFAEVEVFIGDNYAPDGPNYGYNYHLVNQALTYSIP